MLHVEHCTSVDNCSCECFHEPTSGACVKCLFYTLVNLVFFRAAERVLDSRAPAKRASNQSTSRQGNLCYICTAVAVVCVLSYMVVMYDKIEYCCHGHCNLQLIEQESV